MCTLTQKLRLMDFFQTSDVVCDDSVSFITDSFDKNSDPISELIPKNMTSPPSAPFTSNDIMTLCNSIAIIIQLAVSIIIAILKEENL